MKSSQLPFALISLAAWMLFGTNDVLAADAAAPVRITLLGDSLMSDQPPEKPIQGWGTYLEEKLKDAKVTNCGWSGASTKTFIHGDVYADGRPYPPFKWTKTQETPADYWLISFGGNDNNPPGHPKHTDPYGDFASNLSFFINIAKQHGSKVILLTPCRPVFSHGQLPDKLQPYADSMKQVAQKEGTPLIDLYAFTTQWSTDLGPEGLLKFRPAELGGHFNRAGANIIAEEVARQLSRIDPRVAKGSAAPVEGQSH